MINKRIEPTRLPWKSPADDTQIPVAYGSIKALNSRLADYREELHAAQRWNRINQICGAIVLVLAIVFVIVGGIYGWY